MATVSATTLCGHVHPSCSKGVEVRGSEQAESLCKRMSMSSDNAFLHSIVLGKFFPFILEKKADEIFVGAHTRAGILSNPNLSLSMGSNKKLFITVMMRIHYTARS